MSADDVLKIIDAIPEYITYIYPGYLTVYAYYFLRGKTLKETKPALLKSIALSYVYIAMVDATALKNILLKNVFYICIALMIAYIAFQIAKSHGILELFDYLKINTTFYDNEMETLAEFDKGAWLIVYLKEERVVYEGSLGLKELEDGKRKYITLNKYKKYFISEEGAPKKPYIKDFTRNEKEIAMIFYDTIKRVEKRDT